MALRRYLFSVTNEGGVDAYAISGLKVSTGDQYAGLFGIVRDATIKNVVLVSPTVTSNYSGYPRDYSGFHRFAHPALSSRR